MPCSIHPQWPHGSEDCPLCLVRKPDTPPPSTWRTYRCDHCGYESTVKADKHRPRLCTRTNCEGTQSPVADTPPPSTPEPRKKQQCSFCKEWCAHGFCGHCERFLEPPAAPAATPRTCFIHGCGKPDVNAPSEQGTWPTASRYPPACSDHLYLVPPKQRMEPSAAPAESETIGYSGNLIMIKRAESETAEGLADPQTQDLIYGLRDRSECAFNRSHPQCRSEKPAQPARWCDGCQQGGAADALEAQAAEIATLREKLAKSELRIQLLEDEQMEEGERG